MFGLIESMHIALMLVVYLTPIRNLFLLVESLDIPALTSFFSIKIKYILEIPTRVLHAT